MSVLLAWCVATICVVLGWQRRRKLERLCPPGRRQLLTELTESVAEPEALAEGTRRLAIAELNQRLSDVSFELDVVPATFTALTRISLASGSALALVAFMTAVGETPARRAFQFLAAALAGLAGAGAVSTVGRAAKARTRQIRESWDSSSRDIGKALGTRLASVGDNPR